MEETEAADLHTHGKRKRRIYRERRFGVMRDDCLPCKDSFATLRDFWHGGTGQSLRRAGPRCRVAAIVRRAGLF